MISGADLVQALALPAYLVDADGYIVTFNEAAAQLWGRRPVVGVERWSGALRLLKPDGQPMPHEECPIALTLRQQAPVQGGEAVLERPDGTRVPFRPCPSLLRGADGAVIGAVNVMLDLSDRDKADIESARLAAIVSSSDDAIVSKGLDGRINSWNAAATRVFGWEAGEMIGQSIMKIIPIELQNEEREIIARLRRGERVEHFDTVRLTKDGRRINVSLTISPLRNRLGMVVGASKIARDVTDRKRDEQLQRLLFDELNHRVKNTLATIQAIAGQSLRNASSPAAFVTSFNGRIQSLARAHEVLVSGNMKGADVSRIVREQVLLGSGDGTRIVAKGPPVFLPSKAAINLSLVLHELATNARKYGALAHPGGHLVVTWRLFAYPKRELILEWRESGVPDLKEPHNRGFGTTLIERTLETEGGKGVLRYLPGGLACDLILPLPQEPMAADGSDTANEGADSEVSSNVDNGELQGRRVLVIEDEILVAMDIETVLSDAGLEIAGRAGTLPQARQLISELDYDLVLLDGNLGGEFVGELAASLAARRVPFAFATGYGRDGVPAGFRDRPVLAKPFTPEQLLGMVRRLLTRDGSERP
jgi:PAS domain S-box-containing protein